METLITLLKSNLEKATAQLKMLNSCSCIENCNSIVMFENGTTIATENKQPIVTCSLFATQYTPKTANDLCKNITNGQGEHPFIIYPKEYYTLKIKEFTELLEHLKQPA